MQSYIERSGSIYWRLMILRTKLSERSNEERCLRGSCSFCLVIISPWSHHCFNSCQDVLAEMVHTKDGSRVVREFITQGSAKVSDGWSSLSSLSRFYTLYLQDRKHIVKVLKPHVERMCTDDEAQLVLFTALDVIEYVYTPSQPNVLLTLILCIKRHETNVQISRILNNHRRIHTDHNTPRSPRALSPHCPAYAAALHPRTNCHIGRDGCGQSAD